MHRPAECPFGCDKRPSLSSVRDESHRRECLAVVVACKHGCGKQLPRGVMATHERSKCPLRIELCVYGCGKLLRPKEVYQHMEFCPACMRRVMELGTSRGALLKPPLRALVAQIARPIGL